MRLECKNEQSPFLMILKLCNDEIGGENFRVKNYGMNHYMFFKIIVMCVFRSSDNIRLIYTTQPNHVVHIRQLYNYFFTCQLSLLQNVIAYLLIYPTHNRHYESLYKKMYDSMINMKILFYPYYGILGTIIKSRFNPSFFFKIHIETFIFIYFP